MEKRFIIAKPGEVPFVVFPMEHLVNDEKDRCNFSRTAPSTPGRSNSDSLRKDERDAEASRSGEKIFYGAGGTCGTGSS